MALEISKKNNYWMPDVVQNVMLNDNLETICPDLTLLQSEGVSAYMASDDGALD